MSSKAHSRRRWGLLPVALALVFMVLAVPAAAKAPVFNPHRCSPTGKCEYRAAVGESKGLDGRSAGIVAGSVAVVVLMMAGGMLVATHRKDARGRPARVPS